MTIKKYGERNWAVYDESGNLICITVYKKGAIEVVRRLSDQGVYNLHEANINHDELTKLSKELRVVNRKFNQILWQINAIKSKPYEAVLYNQNKKGVEMLCQQK